MLYVKGKKLKNKAFCFTIVGEKFTKKGLKPQKRKKLKNLVVVTSADDNVLITTYRNNNPFKHVAKKPKRIVRYAA